MKSRKSLFAMIFAITLALFATACTKATPQPPVQTEPDGGTQQTEADKGTQQAAPGEEKIVLKLADTQPDSALLVKVERMFGDALAEATGGRITVEVYPASQLGNATTYTQMVQTGDVAMARNDASAVYDFGVESHKILSLPYLFEDSRSALELLNGEIGRQLKQDTADAGLGFIDLGWVVDSNRCFFTAKQDVESMADLKGLKIRSLEASMTVDYKKGLGMSPTPMAFSEVYTSLSTGVIDAAANTLDSFVSNKMYEVCDYFVMNNGIIPVYEMLFSTKVWETLTEEDQALIQKCWDEASEQYLDLMDDLIEEQIAFCEQQGVTFCYPSDEDRWAEATAFMYDKYGTGYEDLIAEIRAGK